MRGWLAALLVVVACSACARTVQEAPAPPRAEPPARDDLVVLLPGPDGKTGAVTVTHGTQQQTLEAPYATARVKQEGTLERGATTAEEAQRAFGPALAALPPRPVTFVLYFQGNSDDLTPESRVEVQKLFPEIAARPAPEVVVVGHTDRVGSIPYNDALSLRRAERMRQELARLGVPVERIAVAGRGEREPLVATDDEVAEPRNRRVEITVR
jgi:outer membrane protein OmpA-like peptidoglycan-associated protein